VRVELILSNDTLDIIAGEIDVALRVGNLPDSNLAARKLSVFRTAVYATPSYIERFGEPLHPDDLVHHRALAMTKNRNGNAFIWALGDGEGKLRDFAVEPIVIANDPAALRGALLGGEGIMLTSDVMVRAYAVQGLVQRVLAGWRGADYDPNAPFPRGQVQSPKVRAFIDFLVERLNFDETYMQVFCEDTERCQHLAAAAAAAEAATAEMHRMMPDAKLAPASQIAEE